MLLCNNVRPIYFAVQKEMWYLLFEHAKFASTMNYFDRLHSIMPFAVTLYLMASLAQLHGTQISWPHVSWAHASFSLAKVESGLRWYAQQIGQGERNEAYFFPGN